MRLGFIFTALVPLAASFGMPAVAEAQQLVPLLCSGVNAPVTCGTCEFIELVNNVIGFIILVASSVAVLIFIYAGFLYVTSGGNAESAKKANSLFTNVVIGYVLILGAFLIVDLVMRSLVNESVLPLGTWRQVECIYPKAPTEGKSRPDGGEALTITGDDFLSDAGVCSASTLTPIFGDRANAAACIAQKESACGAQFFSRTDYDTNKVPFSVSPWQINLTVHEVVGCGETLDCKAAYEGRNFSARIINRPLYDQCVDALKDVTCAAKNADRIQRARGSWKDWSTAKACGL